MRFWTGLKSAGYVAGVDCHHQHDQSAGNKHCRQSKVGEYQGEQAGHGQPCDITVARKYGGHLGPFVGVYGSQEGDIAGAIDCAGGQAGADQEGDTEPQCPGRGTHTEH